MAQLVKCQTLGFHSGHDLKVLWVWGSWVAQSVKRPTSAQIMISQFVSLSPASSSVLTAQSLEPASDSVSPSLHPPLPLCSENAEKLSVPGCFCIEGWRC